MYRNQADLNQATDASYTLAEMRQKEDDIQRSVGERHLCLLFRLLPPISTELYRPQVTLQRPDGLRYKGV
jgi:hypothetical protein